MATTRRNRRGTTLGNNTRSRSGGSWTSQSNYNPNRAAVAAARKSGANRKPPTTTEATVT